MSIAYFVLSFEEVENRQGQRFSREEYYLSSEDDSINNSLISYVGVYDSKAAADAVCDEENAHSSFR